MDLIDRKLLNLIQSKFPLAVEPYRELGDQLGVGAAEVIDRLRELKRQNVLRQVSAIFDTRRLGYKTTLVAFAYPPEALHQGAMRINRHPGVSHNYAREGSYYNLWFTIAVPPDHDIQAVIQRMAQDTGAIAHRVMPTIRFFKIGVNFDMVQQKSNAYNYRPDSFDEDGGSNAAPAPAWNQAVPLTDFDRAVVRELQEDLELAPRPFDGMAQRLGVTPEELFRAAEQMQERKLMRRYSAVLHHRRSGFRSNAMIVWKVPAERSEEVGIKMAQHSAVTHCYERPTFPDWPYTHFTMVHATSPEECEQFAAEIGAATGINEKLLLYSTREYKKTRVRYFVEDYDAFKDAVRPEEEAEQVEA